MYMYINIYTHISLLLTFLHMGEMILVPEITSWCKAFPRIYEHLKGPGLVYLKSFYKILVSDDL